MGVEVLEDSAKDGEMNLTVTGEQQIGIAKPEIERCGTHMQRTSSSSGLSMADDDDDDNVLATYCFHFVFRDGWWH